MAIFPTPSQIQADYKILLKSIKPSLNVNDSNSDFIIRGNAVSGLVSGLYGDQAKANNDTWINSCRSEALDLFGQDYGLPRLSATVATSTGVTLTGVNGTIVGVGALTLIYLPTGVLYTNTTGGTISGGSLTVSVQSLVAGQIANVSKPDSLTLVSPPAGVGNTASVTVSIADGSDIETDDAYRARLLSRRQSPPAGGNETDYKNFAFAANSSVRSVLVRRFGRGLGTVDIYITTGTTDIDYAVTNGIAVVRVPSSTVISEVQAYYNQVVPWTDCPSVYGPTELSVNATVNVDLAAGLTMSSIPSDPVNNPLNLTVMQLIQREVGRAMYKTPVGGRTLTGFTNGFLIAADIEQGLDEWLSAVIDPETGLQIGKMGVLANRQAQPLNGSSYDFPLGANQLAAPGTITVATPVT